MSKIYIDKNISYEIRSDNFVALTEPDDSTIKLSENRSGANDPLEIEETHIDELIELLKKLKKTLKKGGSK